MASKVISTRCVSLLPTIPKPQKRPPVESLTSNSASALAAQLRPASLGSSGGSSGSFSRPFGLVRNVEL